MEFRLTYEGPLMGSSATNPRAKHKHELRKVFHKQLRRLWEVNPMLANWLAFADPPEPKLDWENLDLKKSMAESLAAHPKRSEELADQYKRCGYRFVPLVIPELRFLCGIEVLFLRPAVPGGVMRSADLDNRLKTLFDALRMPQSVPELGGYDEPSEDENPFFVLTSDDSLITHVSIETDMLLEPLPNKEMIDDHDARLVITVTVSPYTRLLTTMGF